MHNWDIKNRQLFGAISGIIIICVIIIFILLFKDPNKVFDQEAAFQNIELKWHLVRVCQDRSPSNLYRLGKRGIDKKWLAGRTPDRRDVRSCIDEYYREERSGGRDHHVECAL